MVVGRWAKLVCSAAVAAAGFLPLSGCSGSVELYSGLSESDANDIVATLAAQNIEAGKSPAKQGFVVSVPQGEFGSAIGLLRANGLPRSAYAGMGDVFKKDGMISTPTEEHARYIYALSQELERTLTGIDGIVMARVHPVLPERLAPGEPLQVAACAVLIKYRPGWDSGLYEDRVRRLVVSSIPGLANAPANNISIVFVPADPAPAALPASASAIQPAERRTSRQLAVAALLIALAAAIVVLCRDGLRPHAKRALGRVRREKKSGRG